MTGLYIPNMELPEPGEAVTITASGTVHRFVIGSSRIIAKSTAIPLRNHGKLADVVFKEQSIIPVDTLTV